MQKILLLIVTLLFAPLTHAATPQQELNALFDADWQWTMRTFPEFATSVGDPRYNDRLSDSSLAGSRAQNAHAREMLARARGIDRAALNEQDAISYDLFIHEKEKALQAAQFYEYNPQPMSQLDGIHISFPQLVSQMPFNNIKDYHNYLARLRTLPRYIDGVIEQLQQGMASGWVAPAVTMQLIPDQLNDFVATLDRGPVSAPFNNMPSSIPQPIRAKLAREGELVLKQAVAPAFRKLETFMREKYVPASRASISASALPAGPAYYAHAVKVSTTTSMTPQEIHELGLREVARIQAQLRGVMQQVGFKGDFAAFVRHLNSDPRFFYTRPEEMLEAYRALVRRADAQLPQLFAELPRAKVDVKPVPAVGAENQAGAYYESGTPDGSRPGYFVANLSKLDSRPKWGMETLTLHEAVPGHHLQTARAQELKAIPNFRRFGWYVAFGEGWALYAESLGGEMGFFSDPYSMAGHLDAELFRAARLVVDTGIHALGWTRQQAIDYLNANTANPPHDNQVEIDRYIMWPGQALGYKIGQLKIRALRDKARAALGDKFDLRRFHNAVIDNGALPLDMLEAQIDRWIAQQATRYAAVR